MTIDLHEYEELPRSKNRNWNEYEYREVPDPENYDIRPKSLIGAKCYKCKHGRRTYHHYRSDNYEDKYQSLICEAAKVPICRNGFIQEEEFSV